MSKHTPGPWEFSKTAHGEAGLSILSIDRSSPSEWVKWEMARVGLNSRQITPETEANARLISAAPELLETAIMCRDILRGIVDGIRKADPKMALEHSLEMNTMLSMVKTTIAKAEGKTLRKDCKAIIHSNICGCVYTGDTGDEHY